MISKKNILDLKSRQEIYQLISKNPGLKVHEISKKLSISRSTVRYHLNYLNKMSIIDNRDNRFYVSEVVGVRDKEIINLLRQEIPFNIIMNLFFPGFCSELELAKELEVHPSTIHFHIKKLLDIGLIKPAERKDGGFISFLSNNSIVYKTKVGREIFYTWNNKMVRDVYGLLITHKESMVDPNIIDEYIEFCNQFKRIFKFSKYQRYFVLNSSIDNIIKILEEIIPFPYHF